MKLLHVIPSVNPAAGGPAEALKQLCGIYHSHGHEIDVASLDSMKAVEGFDFPTDVIGLGPGLGVYGYSVKAAGWYRQNIHRYEAVFLNGIWQYGTLAAYRALEKTGIPYAVIPHGMLDPYFKRTFPLKHIKKTLYWELFLKKIMRDAAVVLYTCEEERLLAKQSFSGYRANEQIVPCGTIGPEISLQSASADFLDHWPVLKGKRLMISLGRIHAKKGIDLLIRSFAEVVADDPAWHLVIAGPDECDLQHRLEQLAGQLGIANRICWTGMLLGQDKWGALAAAELSVLASHQENFGLVVTESLASGTPVIISNKVNIWREIARSGAGLVCEDNLEGLRDSLMKWKTLRQSEVANIGLRSRRCFDEFFNFDAASRKALEIVDQLAGQRRDRIALPIAGLLRD